MLCACALCLYFVLVPVPVPVPVPASYVWTSLQSAFLWDYPVIERVEQPKRLLLQGYQYPILVVIPSQWHYKLFYTCMQSDQPPNGYHDGSTHNKRKSNTYGLHCNLNFVQFHHSLWGKKLWSNIIICSLILRVLKLCFCTIHTSQQAALCTTALAKSNISFTRCTVPKSH